MRELSGPMSPLSTARLVGLLAMASILTLVLVVPPASAKLPQGEFLADRCSGTVSTQDVWTYDNGSVETHPTYGPVAVQREVSLEAQYAGRYPRRGVDLVLGTAYEETEEWEGSVPFAARDSVDSDESDGNSHRTTTNGSTSLKVVLRLGRRVLRFARTPDWAESQYPSKGDNNHAFGHRGLAQGWLVRIRLGGAHLNKLRRHEARGGKTRVSFRYSFPQTTEVLAINQPDVGFTDDELRRVEDTRTWSAVSSADCGATSRPLTLTTRR
jgi:hypothetical protein